jgi:GT2 family glycosyltransferase
MDISIVIVSWNAKRYVEECLTSLETLNKDVSIEIIVVDNASTDGTVGLIRNRFPCVRLVESEKNLGFARANNLGIALTRGKYICLMNPDVKVPADCLSKMYQYMEKEAAIGLLGPKMLGPDGDTRRSGMRFPTLWNCFLRATAMDSLSMGTGLFGGFLMSDFEFDTTRDIDVLNGWFWLARRAAVDEVGLLDERFFMYGEDIDWCKRFHNAGWRVVFYPEAEAVHYGGASSSNAPVRFYLEMQRANLQYWKKHHGPISSYAYCLTVWLNHLVRTLGYSLVYLLKSSARQEAYFKIRRSLACMLWMTGWKHIRQVETQ